ncbi:MAG TPA: hypothetical protein VJM31_00970 [Vicinamibacterales bacterium]|nr:hypothetical protein [Vicinamibacterales bacterium]
MKKISAIRSSSKFEELAPSFQELMNLVIEHAREHRYQGDETLGS